MERRRHLPWLLGGTAGAVGLTALLAFTTGDPEASKSAEPPPTSTPAKLDRPARDMPTVKDLPAPPKDAVDLQQALDRDRSATTYAIRLSADNLEYEAREKAALAARAGHAPFITRGERGYYYVYVGDYTSYSQAKRDESAAEAILGRNAEARQMRSECPSIRWTSTGIHECS